MYKAFFGLKQNPFSPSPDPAFFFPGRLHREALATIAFGVQSRKELVTLTGRAGTGKTTVLWCFREKVASQYADCALLTFPEDRALLHGCFELEKPSVLLLDQSHHLDETILSEVILLNRERKKPLQIILSGQSEVDCKLNKLVTLRAVTKPFDLEESARYIAFRLAQAGMPEQRVFSQTLIQGIHFKSAGIPRMINIMCDNLLITAFAMSRRVATTEMLQQISAEMHL